MKFKKALATALSATMIAGNMTAANVAPVFADDENSDSVKLFEEVEKYHVTANTPNHGSVTINVMNEGVVSGAAVTADELVSSGSVIQVTVAPDDGYELDTFTVGGADKKSEATANANKYTFNLTGETAVVATFKSTTSAVTTYDIDLVASAEKGTVTCDATGNKAKAGDKVTLTVTPNGSFVRDTLKVTDADGTLIDVDKEDDSFIMPASKVTVTATFVATGSLQTVPAEGATLTIEAADKSALTMDGDKAKGILGKYLNLVPGTAGDDSIQIKNSGKNIRMQKKGYVSFKVAEPMKVTINYKPSGTAAGKYATMRVSEGLDYDGAVALPITATTPATVEDNVVKNPADSTVTVDATVSITKPGTYMISAPATDKSADILSIKFEPISLKFNSSSKDQTITVGEEKTLTAVGTNTSPASADKDSITGVTLVVENNDGTKLTVPASAKVGTDGNVDLAVTGAAATGATPVTIKLTNGATDASKLVVFDHTTVTVTAPAAVAHDVTVATGITGGTVTANPTSAEKDTEVTLTVTPDPGYELDTLTYTPDGGSATDIKDAQKFDMPDADVTVNATFKAIEYSVEVSDTITSGSVVATPPKAKKGEKVTVTVTPDTGYKLKANSLKFNDTAVTENAGAYSFTMPAANVTLTAEFEQETYTVTRAGETGKEGQVYAADGTTKMGSFTVSPATAHYGDTVTLVPTAEANYEFKAFTVTAGGKAVKVVEGGTADAPTYTFTMPAANATVSAAFMTEGTVTYGVTVNVADVTTGVKGGTVVAEPATAEEKEKVTLTITPDDGFELDSLQLTGDSISTPAAVTGSTYEFEMPAAAVTANAKFKLKEYTVTTSVKDSVGGALTYDKDTEKINKGTKVTLTATPAEGYQFKALTVDGEKVTATVGANGVATYEVTVGTANITAEAEFTSKETTYKVTLPADDANENAVTATGAVEGVVSGLKTGDTVTLTVAAQNGYRLKSLNVGTMDVTDQVTNNTYTVTIGNSDVTVTAEFEAVYALNTTVTSAADSGELAIEGGKTEAAMGEGVYVLATPAEGYKLKSLVVGGYNYPAATLEERTNADTGVTRVGFQVADNQIADGAIAITAEFESTATAEEHTVTVDTAITHGTVSVSGTATSFAAGATVTLTVSADEGYELKSLKANSTDVTVGGTDEAPTYTFVMPGEDVTVTATFEAVVAPATKYSVTLTQPTSGGTISAGDTTEAAKGDTVTITANASEGFTLSAITVKDATGAEVKTTKTATGVTFTMPASNVTVTAAFVASTNTPKLTVAAVTGGTVKAYKVDAEGATTNFTEAEIAAADLTAGKELAVNDSVILVITPSGDNDLAYLSVKDASGSDVDFQYNEAYSLSNGALVKIEGSNKKQRLPIVTMPAKDLTISVTFGKSTTGTPQVVPADTTTVVDPSTFGYVYEASHNIADGTVLGDYLKASGTGVAAKNNSQQIDLAKGGSNGVTFEVAGEVKAEFTLRTSSMGGSLVDKTDESKGYSKTATAVLVDESGNAVDLTLVSAGGTEGYPGLKIDEGSKSATVIKGGNESNPAGVVSAVLPAGKYTLKNASTDGDSLRFTQIVFTPLSSSDDEEGAYTVTVDTAMDTTNGSIELSKSKADKDAVITVKPTAATGYEVDKVTYKVAGNETATEVTKNEEGKYTFTMPEGNVTVTATFKQAETPAVEALTDVFAIEVQADGAPVAAENGVADVKDAKTFDVVVKAKQSFKANSLTAALEFDAEGFKVKSAKVSDNPAVASLITADVLADAVANAANGKVVTIANFAYEGKALKDVEIAEGAVLATFTFSVAAGSEAGSDFTFTATQVADSNFADTVKQGDKVSVKVAAAAAAADEYYYLLGDADQSGSVNAADASTVLGIAKRSKSDVPDWENVFDVVQSGAGHTVDAADAAQILSVAAKNGRLAFTREVDNDVISVKDSSGTVRQYVPITKEVADSIKEKYTNAVSLGVVVVNPTKE